MKLYVKSKLWWVIAPAFVVLIAFIACGSFWSILTRGDRSAVLKYIARVQPQLSADQRFKDVHLVGYLGVPFRYRLIEMDGHVASQGDKDALEVFISGTKPPLDVTVGIVEIGKK